MVNNKIGCSSNKTVLVDPNNFDGQSSFNNISVPLEDLSILVELVTNKKARTLLTTQKTGTAESTKAVVVNFIEGSDVGTTKSLTTKFTDLTTSFDSNEGENLGITGIDINFTSSYAPMITINFVDVRGSAIFQNEESVSKNNNKYSVFFQLPYPLYELTIKGYYGQPVKYCLHMTKFTSRFNSQTGNFEITASFIGYTYAMLSDMLVGYLKAIEYTTLGGNRYKELKAKDPKLLTLNELYVAVSQINQNTNKLVASDPTAITLANGEQKKEQIDEIRNKIRLLGQGLDFKTDSDTYKFIIADSAKKDTSAVIEAYNKDIRNYIETVFNPDTSTKLEADDFASIQNVKDTGVTIDFLKNQTATNYVAAYQHILKSEDIYGFSDTKTFDLYDLRFLYKKLDDAYDEIDAELKVYRKTLAETLRANIRGNLGFDPTVRNVINVMTTAVEVFLYVLYEISKSAEANVLRTDELKAVFKKTESSDIKSNANGASTTSSKVDIKYYPWPDYASEEGEIGFVQKYLGSPNVLKNTDNVNELVFIDDLMDAFIKQSQITQNNEILLQQLVKNWYSVNPVDTRLFVDKFPYKRIEANTKEEVEVMVMLRAMIALGYSNKDLTEKEITMIAKLDGDAILADIANQNVLQALTQISASTLTNASGLINSQKTSVVRKLGNEYYYDYILHDNLLDDNNIIKLIPINNNFTGNWNEDGLQEKADGGSVFLTNYKTTNDHTVHKFQDGGKYIKIIDRTEYDTKAYSLPFNKESDDITLQLANLKAYKSSDNVGFNLVGGKYGVQEFTKLNYGSSDLDNLPFMYMFYSDSNYGSKVYNKSNGLGLKRSVSGIDGKITTSPFDLVGKRFTLPSDNNEVIRYIDFPGGSDSNYKLHKDYGKTKILSNKYLNSASKDITYPFVNFQVENESAMDGMNLYPVSLFGSRLYNEQTSNEAKALLFLHSFPWNGLVADQLEYTTKGIFDRPEILNTFSRRAGFVSVPKIWATFIGGMLWRYDESSEPIKFHDGSQSFIPYMIETDNSFYPLYDEYLTFSQDSSLSFCMKPLDNLNNRRYKKIDSVILGLPEQAKAEFKKVFLEFVSSNINGVLSEWDIIRNKLEITTADWTSNYDAAIQAAVVTNAEGKTSCLIDTFKTFYNLDNYIIATPINDENLEYNIFLELKDDSQAVNAIMSLFIKDVIISNSTYRIWETPNDNEPRSNIKVSEKQLNLYLDTLISKLKEKTIENTASDEKKQTLALFGTSDKNVIKLTLYNTCKNIYDKWIGGAIDGENIIFQCGGRNTIDSVLAKNRGDSTPKLIDSFRFVTRSFKDIGDELAINPIPVNDYLRDNPNSSFYNMVTNLLSSNNFDFIPLPTYIDYKRPDMVESIFKPYPNYEAQLIKDSCGPSFVCVYLGQNSKHLDFNDSNYSNDGFDARCNGRTIVGLPKDFSESLRDNEDTVTFFNVRFGQQNQDIFKDIILDQSEFGETAESLQIIDDISKKGAETNRTLAGQNIYNVYGVRSYKVEIEMLGDAMIQPMMYFQLDNIPMFHGAYMITKVRHALKPNSMSTHFTGVRIRKVETPIFNLGDLSMSLLDTIDITNNGNGQGFVNNVNYVDSYYIDLTANKPNSLIIDGSTIPNKKKLTDRAEQEIKNWKDGALKENDGRPYLDVYSKATPGLASVEYSTNQQSWGSIFISYLMLAGDDKFPKATIHYNYVTAAMNGVEGYEVFALKAGLNIKAEVGDIFCVKKIGSYMSSNCDVIYKVNDNTASLVGGDVSESIKIRELTLNNGYVTDTTEVGVYKLLVKKTGNKFYSGKKLINTGNHYETNGGVDSSTGCPKKNNGFPSAVSYKASIEQLINKTFVCEGRKCYESFEGFKQIPEFFVNGVITKRGVFAMSIGLTEGLGSQPVNKNPGNIKGNNGFVVYNTWVDGWKALNQRYLTEWVNGDVPPTASAKYPNCYNVETNKYFDANKIKFKELEDYGYVNNYQPTLRQFINIYAPWGDKNNPSQYIAHIALTLKDYGHAINVDDKIATWIS